MLCVREANKSKNGCGAGVTVVNRSSIADAEQLTRDQPCSEYVTMAVVSLAVSPAHHIHQFGDLAPLVRLVARRDRMLDAMRDMIAQHLFLDPPQRCTGGGDLRDDVDAIAIVFHHARETANLAFDPFQPLQAR